MLRLSKRHRSHNTSAHHSSSGHIAASSGFMLAPGLGPGFLEIMDGASEFDEDTEEDEDEHDFDEEEEEVSGVVAPVHANAVLLSTAATPAAAVSSVTAIVPHSHTLTQEEEEDEDEDAMEQEDAEEVELEEELEVPHLVTAEGGNPHVATPSDEDAASVAGVWTDIPDASSTPVVEDGTQQADTDHHEVTMTSPTPPSAAFTNTAGEDPGAYWYAYNSYMDTMQGAPQLSSSHCASTSYNSTRTGTTAESAASTLMTMSYPPHHGNSNGNGNGNGHNHHSTHHHNAHHHSNSSGERISDCTAADIAGGWDDHDHYLGAETEGEEEGDQDMFFEVDEA